MADPIIGERNNRGYVWDGSRWQRPAEFQDATRQAPPLGLLGSVPQRPAPGPWNATDTKATNEWLKQLFTIGGSTLGSYLGPSGTVAGGGVGRVIGSIPERLTAAATRQPAPTSVLEDAPIGAMEGAVAEILPWATHTGLKYGGQAARWLGSRLRGNWVTGVPGVPLDVGGELAQIAAEKMGPGSLSTRMRRGTASAPPNISSYGGPGSAGSTRFDIAPTAGRMTGQWEEGAGGLSSIATPSTKTDAELIAELAATPQRRSQATQTLKQRTGTFVNPDPADALRRAEMATEKAAEATHAEKIKLLNAQMKKSLNQPLTLQEQMRASLAEAGWTADEIKNARQLARQRGTTPASELAKNVRTRTTTFEAAPELASPTRSDIPKLDDAAVDALFNRFLKK